MQIGRRDPDMWLKGVALGSYDVDIGWNNSVRKGWSINQDPELAPGA